MKKRFWLSAIAACGISLSALGANNSEAAFNATIKHLDMGGETLYYQNASGLHELVNNTIPKIVTIATQDMPESAEKSAIINGVNSLIKLINISAFKASGLSSKEIAPGLYDLKLFTLLDRSQKSILFQPVTAAKPLAWRNLPADTVLAFAGKIDLGYVWQMIYQEMLNNPDPMIKMFAAQIEPLKQSGIDVNAMLNSIRGELKFTVSASDMQSYAISVIIPDADGAVSAFMKRQLPPPQGNKLTIPTPVGNVDITYLRGKIKAILKSAAYTPVAGKLGYLPEFKAFSRFAPSKGNGYLVVSGTTGLLNNIIRNLPEEAKVLQSMLSNIKPVAVLSVWHDTADGCKGEVFSTFSIPQLQQSGAFFAPYAAILLPALNSARDRDRTAVCINNLKQFGVAAMIYANDHQGILPANIGQVALDRKVTEDIIMLLPKVDLNKLTTPATTPLAICDRATHTEKSVCILYADGHVTSLPVAEDDDEEDIVKMLIRQNNLPQNIADIMIKAVDSEE